MQVVAPFEKVLALIYDGLVVTALILISGLVASVIVYEAPARLTRMLIVLSVGGYFGGLGRMVVKPPACAWRLRLVGLRRIHSERCGF